MILSDGAGGGPSQFEQEQGIGPQDAEGRGDRLLPSSKETSSFAYDLQWSCWQVESQYLTLHRTHRGASWASGTAQAAQFRMIILRWLVVCEGRARRFFCLA